MKFYENYKLISDLQKIKDVYQERIPGNRTTYSIVIDGCWKLRITGPFHPHSNEDTFTVSWLVYALDKTGILKWKSICRERNVSLVNALELWEKAIEEINRNDKIDYILQEVK